MKLKKLLTLALSLCLALSVASCSQPGGADDKTLDPSDRNSPGSSDSPGVSNSPSNSETPGQSGPAPDYVNEFTQQLAGIDADTVMFTVDGIDVTAEYYLYWLSYDCYRMDMYSQMYLGLPLDFDETATDGLTFAEYMKDDGRKMAISYLLLEKTAAEKGLGASEEQLAQAAEEKASFIAEEGEDGFDKLLRQQGLSEEMFDRLNILSSCLTANILDDIPAPTEEEMEQFISENDLLRAKHILIRTVQEKDDGTVEYARGGSPTNEDGSTYTGTAEEFNAAARAKVDELLAQLAEAEDTEALFDQLMQENSEDPGLATYPNGYDFTANEMHEGFEQGVRDLEYGEYGKEPVETSDGYHIIMRLRPDVEDTCRQAKLGEMMAEWGETEYTATPAYENLDVKDFYEKYIAYMETFMDDPQESDSSTDDPNAPTDDPNAPSDSSPEATDSQPPTDSPSDGPVEDAPSDSPAEDASGGPVPEE